MPRKVTHVPREVRVYSQTTRRFAMQIIQRSTRRTRENERERERMFTNHGLPTTLRNCHIYRPMGQLARFYGTADDKIKGRRYAESDALSLSHSTLESDLQFAALRLQFLTLCLVFLLAFFI